MKGKKDILSKKGFYIVLYSCIGVVLVSAGVIAYTARDVSQQTPMQQEHVAMESIDLGSNSINMDDLAAVGQTDVRSYLDLVEDDTAFFRPREDDAEEQAPKGVEPQENNNEATAPSSGAQAPTIPAAPATVHETPYDNSGEAQEATTVIEESLEVANYGVTSILSLDTVDYYGEESADISSSEQFEFASIEGITTGDGTNNQWSAISEPVFNIFGDEQVMAWPIVGEVLMNFSMDRTIYDITLQQFRTNDSISIQANAGDIVRSAAEGVVREITNTRVNGISVVVDHGNGWTTTYSQLDEDLFISEGDVLLEGQRIGIVGEPSIHRVLLGNHVGFRVERNGVPHDPNLVLAEK